MTREVPGNLYVCSVLAVVNTNQSLETGGAQERKKEKALKSYSSRYEEFFRSSSKGNLRIVKMATLGGIRDSHGSQNSVELEDLARFAVQEHNKKQNAMLEFARLVKAQEQVVAGTMHHLTLEVIDAGKKKIYEAKVWVKPWLNFKELQEFKHVGDTSPSLTSSDLGVKKDGHGEGWKSVATHDPQVQDAANHAMNTIKQKSNSLVPYELQEVVHAKAEVIEELAKFEMLLKVKRGSKEEKIKVQVHKNKEGTFHVNQMESDST